MRPLRIAQVAPLWTRVPPTTYGGTELIVHLLTEELVRRGHEVTLFATGDSRTSGSLRSVCEQGLTERMEKGEVYEYDHYEGANLAEALRHADRFDVIHSHLGPAKIPFHAASRTPVLHTISQLPTPDDRWLLDRYPDAHVAAVSARQMAEIPAERRRSIRVIHNGCDFDAFEPSTGPGRYLAFLGRMGRQKSPLDAIRIARAAGLPLVLAGEPMNRGERSYFADEVKPLIDGVNVRHIGAVDHAQKNDLLKGASALLFPIQWDEPFGLVMIEAMACGTPVVACNRGAVGEVVDPGVTGFYADSPDALAALVPRALSLDRAAVRAHAMKRFSHKRMVDEYVEAYRSLLEGAGAAGPRS